MATIEIDRLEPITDYNMDIHKINLLIGEQATGKSTICKAIYFFHLVKEEIIEYLYRISIVGKDISGQNFPKVLNGKVKDICRELFGFSWDLPNDLKVKYSFTDNVMLKTKSVLRYAKEFFHNKVVLLYKN